MLKKAHIFARCAAAHPTHPLRTSMLTNQVPSKKLARTFICNLVLRIGFVKRLNFTCGEIYLNFYF